MQPRADGGDRRVRLHVVEDLAAHADGVEHGGDVVRHVHVVQRLVGHNEGALLPLELLQAELERPACGGEERRPAGRTGGRACVSSRTLVRGPWSTKLRREGGQQCSSWRGRTARP